MRGLFVLMSAAEKRVGRDLTEGSIYKGLALFAAPIVLAALIQQLYSVVDLIIIGQYMGNTGTVGVSTGGEMADLVTPIASSFATGGQIYIAQLVGARREEGLKKATGSLITFLMLMSVALMIPVLVFCRPILNLLNCPAEAMGQATSYMIITTIGFPFIFGYNAVCGVLRGMGESKAPMRFIIIAAVMNIFLDLLFVVVFKMEAAGTAIATIAAQFASFAAAFVFMLRHKETFEFELKPSSFKMYSADVKVICKLGFPQAVRTTLVHFSMLWINASINSYGLVISSTNSIGNKLQKFLNIFVVSAAQASAAMVGQNLGAGKKDRAANTVWATLSCCLAFAVLTCIVIVAFPKAIFGVFTADEAVLAMARSYLTIMTAHFIWSAFTSAFQSMVIGAGNASLNFVIGILDGIVCKIGISYVCAYALGMGATGFFIGTAWSRCLPAVICFIYFISGKWKTRKLLIND